MTTAQLKAWRKSKEFTTDQMADYFGISDRKYRDIEKNPSKIEHMMIMLYEKKKEILELKREIKVTQQAVNLSNKSEAYLLRLKSICEEQIEERDFIHKKMTEGAYGKHWAVFNGGMNEEDEKTIKLINEELEARR